MTSRTGDPWPGPPAWAVLGVAALVFAFVTLAPLGLEVTLALLAISLVTSAAAFVSARRRRAGGLDRGTAAVAALTISVALAWLISLGIFVLTCYQVIDWGNC